VRTKKKNHTHSSAAVAAAAAAARRDDRAGILLSYENLRRLTFRIRSHTIQQVGISAFVHRNKTRDDNNVIYATLVGLLLFRFVFFYPFRYYYYSYTTPPRFCADEILIDSKYFPPPSLCSRTSAQTLRKCRAVRRRRQYNYCQTRQTRFRFYIQCKCARRTNTTQRPRVENV